MNFVSKFPAQSVLSLINAGLAEINFAASVNVEEVPHDTLPPTPRWVFKNKKQKVAMVEFDGGNIALYVWQPNDKISTQGYFDYKFLLQHPYDVVEKIVWWVIQPKIKLAIGKVQLEWHQEVTEQVEAAQEVFDQMQQDLGVDRLSHAGIEVVDF